LWLQEGWTSGKWKNERRRRLNIKMKTSKFSTIILKDNVLEYVALRGSDRDVNKETRRFVAASKDSAVEELSKDTVYSRVDLVNILSVATVGEIREYERGPWVYIPENPKDHPNLIQFYKKYHPVRYLETVIHGYPKHFTEEDVRNAPKTLPKSFIEYLLKNSCSEHITNVAQELFQYFNKLGVPGLEETLKLAGAFYVNDTESEEYENNIHTFLSTLNEKGLHVGEKVYTRILRTLKPMFVEEYLAYEKYMQTTNADKYIYSANAQRAAKLLAEGFQTFSRPDEPSTLTGGDPSLPPTEVAELFEYYLHYGSEKEVNRVANIMRRTLTRLDFGLNHEYLWFNLVQTRSDLQTLLTNVNPGAVKAFYEREKEEGFSTFYNPDVLTRKTREPEDIRDHPALAKYYKRFFILNYIEMISYKTKAYNKQGPVILDEIETVCPVNRLEHCLKYGTEKEVHVLVETIINKNAELRSRLKLFYPNLLEKKNKGMLYTRGDLRQMLTLSPQMGAKFDPNEDYGVYRIVICGLSNPTALTEIIRTRYVTLKDRDKYIR
jgi:hypothetical protein